MVQGERYKTIPDEVRKYAMGYYGRLAAEPSGAFMERAGIHPRDIVSERPGEHIAPWLPRLRSELGAKATEEDLLLAAFYEKELLAPLKKQAATNYAYRTTPLLELIQYVGLKPDLGRMRIRFAGADLMVGR